MENRRKVSGIVVDSRALLRFAIPFILLIVASVGSIMIIDWEVLAALTRVETVTNYDPSTSATITESVSTITHTGMLSIFVIGCICLGFWVVYSHRIFGPTVPFRRHVQNLLDGDYSSRINLRKRDEFKELAEDLNQLAEMLANQKSKA